MKLKKRLVSNKFLVLEKEFRSKNYSVNKVNFLLVPTRGGIEVLSQTGAYYGTFTNLADFEIQCHFKEPKIKCAGSIKIKLEK